MLLSPSTNKLLKIRNQSRCKASLSGADHMRPGEERQGFWEWKQGLRANWKDNGGGASKQPLKYSSPERLLLGLLSLELPSLFVTILVHHGPF